MDLERRALILWLRGQHEALVEQMEDAKTAFPDPEPLEKVRRWVWPAGIMMLREPNEGDPQNQWEWTELRRTPPHLRYLELQIDAFGRGIDYLEGEGKG